MSSPHGASVLRWVATGLYRSGLVRPLAMAAAHTGSAGAFQIHTYHRVNDECDPFFPAVSTAVFEQRMAYIARTYRVLTVEELVDRARKGRVPRRALAITFDDGYRDNLIHAAPILARYGLRATVFLTTGLIGTDDVPWFDRLAMAFKHTRSLSVYAPWGERLSLGTQTDRLEGWERSLGYLKRVSDDARLDGVEKLCDALGGVPQPGGDRQMLSWAEVRRLQEMGVAIGGHTVNHPVLSRVSPQRAWTEITDARDAITSACGRAPRAFAYPNGGPEDYTEEVKGMVREAGFTCAATTRFGLNTRDTCAYELRRGGPWEDHLPVYALKLMWYGLHSGYRRERGGPRRDVFPSESRVNTQGQEESACKS